MPNPFHIPSGTTVLIAHAHPDDEAVACGAAIRALAHDQEITVHSVTATDGEKSTKGDSLFVSTGQRRQEVEAAYTVLGIPRTRQHYFALPDGELSTHQPELVGLLINLVHTYDISVIVTPGPDGFDGHPDHIAIHEAVMQVKRQLILDDIAIKVWALQANHDGTVTVPVNTEDKLKAVAKHHSQFPITSTPEGTFILSPATKREFALPPYDRLVYKEEAYTIAT